MEEQHNFSDDDNFGEPRCTLCGMTKIQHWKDNDLPDLTPNQVTKLFSKSEGFRVSEETKQAIAEVANKLGNSANQMGKEGETK